MRSQAEIRARFDKLRHGEEPDPFGFRGEAIIEAMERPTVADLLKDANAEWHSVDLPKTMTEYLRFAVGKALGHRGISASRSVEKFEIWLWCLGDQDLADHFESADYAPYGAPKLQVLVDYFGWNQVKMDDGPDLPNSEAWQRMARGEPCQPGCREGCSS